MPRMEQIHTKEQYLLWRRDWKARYKSLSLAIREIKLHIRILQKQGFSSGQLQNEREWMRKQAREMLEELAEAKEYAAMRRKQDLSEAA